MVSVREVVRGRKLRTGNVRAGILADRERVCMVRDNRWGSMNTGCERVGECEESNGDRSESHGRNVLGQNKTQVGVG